MIDQFFFRKNCICWN